MYSYLTLWNWFHLTLKRIWRLLEEQAEMDVLNECFCGFIVKLSSEGALLCKKKGCEIQWVCDFLIQY